MILKHKENSKGQKCAKERLVLLVVLYMAVVQAAPCVWNSKLYTHLLFVQQADNLKMSLIHHSTQTETYKRKILQ